MWEEGQCPLHPLASIGISVEMFAQAEKTPLPWKPNVFSAKLSLLVGEQSQGCQGWQT